MLDVMARKLCLLCKSSKCSECLDISLASYFPVSALRGNIAWPFPFQYDIHCGCLIYSLYEFEACKIYSFCVNFLSVFVMRTMDLIYCPFCAYCDNPSVLSLVLLMCCINMDCIY